MPPSKKTIIDFDFDTASPIPILGPASVVKLTGIKMYKMPGVDLPSNAIFQFIQKEWLKIDYDEFVNKPVDYLVRKYLPEIFSLFEPLRRLPPIPVCLLNPYTFYLTLLPVLADPEFTNMLIKLMAAAQEQKQYLELASKYMKRMEKLGYPIFKGFTIYSPFDLLSDQVGGTSVIIDCYRRPDEVKKAVEKLACWNVEIALHVIRKMATAMRALASISMVFIPLHAGPFLSRKHFEEIYWPPLKKVIHELASHNLISLILFEGDWTRHLEYLKELPKGKSIAWFEKADLFKAKEVIGDRVCIKGNVSPALLTHGTPKEIETYCKKLIDNVGDGGGYILDAGTLLEYEMKPENIKAMVNIARKYGVYRK
jgi:uroporphyrinogen-III decarboxylase